jgi:hypothetical protein
VLKALMAAHNQEALEEIFGGSVLEMGGTGSTQD